MPLILKRPHKEFFVLLSLARLKLSRDTIDMKFLRSADYFTINIDMAEIENMSQKPVFGLRDGIFDSNSKVTVSRPRIRSEWEVLRRSIAKVTLDPGLDIDVITDTSACPVNGFTHEVPKDVLLAASYLPREGTECIPEGGIRVQVDPVNPDAPSIWTRVIDAATNEVEIVRNNAFWYSESR
jgi:hypothetical protein